MVSDISDISNRDTFYVDEDKSVLDLYRAGLIISYISMLMNIVIFTILCRKALRSPATILMQGLAVADLLTAFSYYGLEPIFQSKYSCVLRFIEDIEFYVCYLPYPYCSIDHHLSILSFTFHNVSTLITTCLGIQKVIAIRFPIWTKNQLTKQKAAICCVFCFLLSVALGFPRHFGFWTEKDYTYSHISYGTDFSDVCLVQYGNDAYLNYIYSSVTYLLIQTVLLTSCFLVMLISTIFIVYKLITNKFTGRMTKQRRQERRSVAMVIVVLMMIIITEVPKVIVYLWWCFNYINGNFGIDTSEYGMKLHSGNVLLIQRYEFAMSWWLANFTDMFSNNYMSAYLIFSMLMEGIRLFTIIGCMSNFIIYIMMSTKMRNEIVLLFKQIIICCTHKGQMKQIGETRPGRTQAIDKTAMIKTEQSGQSCSHEIRRNTSEQQDKICTHEIEMNTFEQQGQSRTHDIEMDSSEHQNQNHSHELELITSEYQGQSLTHDVENTTIEQPGKSRTNEVEMDTIEQTGQSRAREIEINSSEHQDQNHSHEIGLIISEYQGQILTHVLGNNTIEKPGKRRTHEVEINTIEQPGQIRTPEVDINTVEQLGQRHTHDIEMNTIEHLGKSRTHEVAKNTIEKPGQDRTHEVAMNTIEQPGQSRTHEIEMNRLEQPGQSRIHQVDMNTIEQPEQSRTHKIEMERLEQPGQSRIHEVEINTTDQPGQSRIHEVEMNTLKQPGQRRTHEIEMNRSEQPGQSRIHEVEMNTIEQPGQSRIHEVEINTIEQP